MKIDAGETEESEESGMSGVSGKPGKPGISGISGQEGTDGRPTGRTKKRRAPRSLTWGPGLRKGGGDLLSRIALQYHRRWRA